MPITLDQLAKLYPTMQPRKGVVKASSRVPVEELQKHILYEKHFADPELQPFFQKAEQLTDRVMGNIEKGDKNTSEELKRVMDVYGDKFEPGKPVSKSIGYTLFYDIAAQVADMAQEENVPESLKEKLKAWGFDIGKRPRFNLMALEK